MKASTTLKPLVFAMAAAMAFAAQANQQGGHHSNHRYDPLMDRSAGDAQASVSRHQTIASDVHVRNEGTVNSVNLSGTLNDNEGNVGANIAAGTMNQQFNDAAIAVADENFVFGTATASTHIVQTNKGGTSSVSGGNSVTASDFGNGTSGNVGINVAAGDLNQQANALTIATAHGWKAKASTAGDQSLSGTSVDNKAAGVIYEKSHVVSSEHSTTHSATGSMSADSSWSKDHQSQSASSSMAAGSVSTHHDSATTANSSYSSSLEASMAASQSSSASGGAYLDVAVDASGSVAIDIDRGRHGRHGRHGNDTHYSAEGSLTLNVDAEKSWGMNQQSESMADLSKSVDKTSAYAADSSHDMNKHYTAEHSASEEHSQSASGSSSYSKGFSHTYEEVGSSTLASSSTYTKTRTFINPVTNSVDLSNALNGTSGNLGVNVAAGTSNQQLNTMTIAVGCNACAQ